MVQRISSPSLGQADGVRVCVVRGLQAATVPAAAVEAAAALASAAATPTADAGNGSEDVGNEEAQAEAAEVGSGQTRRVGAGVQYNNKQSGLRSI